MVAWGVSGGALLAEGASAGGVALAIGLPVAVIATGMVALAVRGMHAVATLRGGRRAIARWTVSADELIRFAADNLARNAHGPAYANGWTPPADLPAAGIAIAFDPDGALVGDTYFPLVTTGLVKFAGVQMLPGDPAAIEFGMVVTLIGHAPGVQVSTTRSVLRLPVSRSAQAGAVRVLDHHRRVDAREEIVNAGRYRAWLRAGLAAAPFCFALAAAGFMLEGSDVVERGSAAPFVMVVIGAMAGLAALIMALFAWSLGIAQHRIRRV